MIPANITFWWRLPIFSDNKRVFEAVHSFMIASKHFN